MVRLSELIANLSPASFTVIAMLIFLVVFAGILVRTFRPSSREEQRRAVDLPFDDGGTP